MNNSDRDLFDDDLAAALRSRAGGAATVSDAHEAVLHRATTIRRRRAAVGGAGIAVLAVAGIAMLPRGADEVGTADTVATVVDTVAPSSTAPLPITPTSVDGGSTGTTIDIVVPTPTSDATTTTAETSTTGAPGAEGSTTVAPSTTASSAGSTTSTTSKASTTSSTSSTSTTTTTPTTTTQVDAGPAPFTRTYSSTGGSITVSWNGSALSLDAVTPAAGYTAEVEDQSADRVRVRFEGAGDSRIEIRVEDGEVRERIE